MKQKIIIIGGGVAGLTAGIYAQKAGFDSVVYEKNRVLGGQCTGWKRKGFYIDNCITWMTNGLPGPERRIIVALSHNPPRRATGRNEIFICVGTVQMKKMIIPDMGKLLRRKIRVSTMSVL